MKFSFIVLFFHSVKHAKIGDLTRSRTGKRGIKPTKTNPLLKLGQQLYFALSIYIISTLHNTVELNRIELE